MACGCFGGGKDKTGCVDSHETNDQIKRGSSLVKKKTSFSKQQERRSLDTGIDAFHDADDGISAPEYAVQDKNNLIINENGLVNTPIISMGNIIILITFGTFGVQKICFQ